MICIAIAEWLYEKVSQDAKAQAYSADIVVAIGIISNVSSTCIVLALVVGRQDCQPYLRMVWEMHALQCIEHPNITIRHIVLQTYKRKPRLRAYRVHRSNR